LPANHSDKVGKPHRRHETFARDITDCEYKVAVELQQADEIAGEVTNWEYLAGELIGTAAKVTRTAKFSLHLCGFVHGAADIVVLAL
jgi:hypothetical protein